MRGKALSFLALCTIFQLSDWCACCHATTSKKSSARISAIKAGDGAVKARKTQISGSETTPVSVIFARYKNLTYRQILDENTVVSGIYSAERKELCEQLTTLKANGYDVNQATRQFFALEDLVRTGQNQQVTSAFTGVRQSIAESVAKAQGVSVASSRTINWQR